MKSERTRKKRPLHDEPRRGRLRGLVKGALLTHVRSSQTPPRAKSGRGNGTWYVTSVSWRYKPSLAPSLRPLSRIDCNMREENGFLF